MGVIITFVPLGIVLCFTMGVTRISTQSVYIFFWVYPQINGESLSYLGLLIYRTITGKSVFYMLNNLWNLVWLYHKERPNYLWDFSIPIVNQNKDILSMTRNFVISFLESEI